MEVRFRDSRQIHDFVFRAVERTLAATKPTASGPVAASFGGAAGGDGEDAASMRDMTPGAFHGAEGSLRARRLSTRLRPSAAPPGGGSSRGSLAGSAAAARARAASGAPGPLRSSRGIAQSVANRRSRAATPATHPGTHDFDLERRAGRLDPDEDQPLGVAHRAAARRLHRRAEPLGPRARGHARRARARALRKAEGGAGRLRRRRPSS